MLSNFKKLILITVVIFSRQAFANSQIAIGSVDKNISQINIKDIIELLTEVDSFFDLSHDQKLMIDLKTCINSDDEKCSVTNFFNPKENVISFFPQKYYKESKQTVGLEATKFTLIHEYGHYIFQGYQEQSNLFLESEDYFEKGPGNSPTFSFDELQYKEEITRNFASFNELFADLMVAIYFDNPDIMCFSWEKKDCSIKNRKARKFSIEYTETELDKYWMVSHNRLAGARFTIWQSYLRLKDQGMSKREFLDKVAKIFVQQADLAMKDLTGYNKLPLEINDHLKFAIDSL